MLLEENFKEHKTGRVMYTPSFVLHYTRFESFPTEWKQWKHSNTLCLFGIRYILTGTKCTDTSLIRNKKVKWRCMSSIDTNLCEKYITHLHLKWNVFTCDKESSFCSKHFSKYSYCINISLQQMSEIDKQLNFAIMVLFQINNWYVVNASRRNININFQFWS